MPSYLEDTYLGGLNDEFAAELGADGATSALSPAPGEEYAGSSSDLVRLPGGIVMPRKTLWLLVGAIAVTAVILWMRKRDRRERRLERRLNDIETNPAFIEVEEEKEENNDDE